MMETAEIKRLLEKAKEECLKNVDDSQLLADALDKMFNYGVLRMFHVALMKVYDEEEKERKAV